MNAELSHIVDQGQTTTDERSLDSKTCVIPGASRGIGRAIAVELGRRGANVVVNYRSSETAAFEVVDEVVLLETLQRRADAALWDVYRVDDILLSEGLIRVFEKES
jgi:NAD(P)-dependent dehydrogenase (short-subunit alcohol dehydrogenase family)